MGIFGRTKVNFEPRNPLDDLPDLGNPHPSYRQTRNIADLQPGRVFTIGQIEDFVADEVNIQFGFVPENATEEAKKNIRYKIGPEHLKRVLFDMNDCVVMLNEEQERFYNQRTAKMNDGERRIIDKSIIARLNLSGNRERLIQDAMSTQTAQATVYEGVLGEIVERHFTGKGRSSPAYKCAVAEVALPILAPTLGDEGFAVDRNATMYSFEEEIAKTNRPIYFMEAVNNSNRPDLTAKYGLVDGTIRQGRIIYEIDAPGFPFTAAVAKTLEPTMFGTERENYAVPKEGEGEPLVVSEVKVLGLEGLLRKLNRTHTTEQPRQVISEIVRTQQPPQKTA